MNHWTEESVKFANKKDYLDQLFKIYKTSLNERRVIQNDEWYKIVIFLNNGDYKNVVKELLKLDLFPIQDSYVSYLRKDQSSIERNPETIKRIGGIIEGINKDAGGPEGLRQRCTEPKVGSRQMGQKFHDWISLTDLGGAIYKNSEEFLKSNGNAVLNCSDTQMTKFAEDFLGYNGNRKIDFLARFNGKYIIGEAKFLSDVGGSQNNQFENAIKLLDLELEKNKLNAEVIKIAILDGVLYINGNNKMQKYIKDENNDDKIIISALLLKKFLTSLQ